MTNSNTPPNEDLKTAERASESVDERIPERTGTDTVPATELPGAFGAYVPQAGIGATGPLEGGALGPGEAALDRERQAQRAPIQRG